MNLFKQTCIYWMFSLLNVTIYVCVCFSDSPSFQNQIVAMYVYCLLLLIILVIYTSMAKVIVNKYTYIIQSIEKGQETH